MMRVFSSLLIAFALCCLTLAADPAHAASRPWAKRPSGPASMMTKPALGGRVTNPDPPFFAPKNRAGTSIPGHDKPGRPNEKMAGTCDIYCNDGSGASVPSDDVQMCACQCAYFCGGSCDAIDLGTGERASC